MNRVFSLGFLSAVALLLATGATLAQSQSDLDKLKGEIQSQRERADELGRKSKALAAELKSLRDNSISLARRTQDGESRLTTLEAKLQKTREAVRVREQGLALRNQQLGETLSVLERLSRNPPRALLMSRGRPVDVIRQAMLLRTALPAIQSRANDLREEIDILAEARKEIARQLITLQHATQDTTVNRKDLDEIIARKSALLSQTKSERTRVKRRIKRLALEARTLKELFARLEAERPPPPPPVPAQPDPKSNDTSAPPQKPVETARLVLPRPETLRPFPEGGTITLPARGNIDQRYGENNRYGNTAKGITIKTRPAAQIVAPYDGKVVFAGPFRSYRQILIIEHTDGYHTLLAGMVRVDTAVGQWLLAGEPVGVMARSKNAVPRLYFELRRKGQPVNPLPWFVEHRKRVRG